MKALYIHAKEDIRVDEVPTPEPGEGQILLRMAYNGICGSDLHYYFEGANGAFVVREPLIPGHEVSGTVAKDPSGKYAEGTPVTVHPAHFGDPSEKYGRHLWPNGDYLGSASTWPHTQGGMSEYRAVKEFMLRELPEGLSLKEAALAEPLAVALHAIRIAGGVEGKKVLVTGSGPIGLCAVAAAVALGASEVAATDMLDGPLKRARALGATATYKAGEQDVPQTAFDVALECSGVAPAVSQALSAVRAAGIVVQVGILPAEPIAVNLAPLVSREVQYLGTFRFDDEIDQAITLLAANPSIGKVVTHVIDAEHIIEAFETARNSQESGKVVVSLWLDD